MNRIAYTKPSITELEIRYANDAVKNGWGEACYAYIQRFEREFSRYLGVKHAIATSSCTGALHMGLAALGIGPGDEIILADTNWIATAAPICYLGAKPVMVDILPDTWCIDPARAEAAITPRTKAIIATHIYGNLCEMDELLAIGERHGIAIIEDAAEAIGSEYRIAKAGSLGRFGVFSFHGTKTMTCGEGGIFVTNDSALYEHVLILSNHGRSTTQSKQFWPDMLGFKYKMSNVQAAIGCAQLERIDALVEKKRAVFAYYNGRLSEFAQIKLNPEKAGTRNGYWMPTLVFDKTLEIKRDDLIQAFARANIDARVFFWPLSSLDIMSCSVENFNAQDIAERAINIPSYHDLSEQDMARVCEVVEGLMP